MLGFIIVTFMEPWTYPIFTNRACAFLPQPWIGTIYMELQKEKWSSVKMVNWDK